MQLWTLCQTATETTEELPLSTMKKQESLPITHSPNMWKAASRLALSISIHTCSQCLSLFRFKCTGRKYFLEQPPKLPEGKQALTLQGARPLLALDLLSTTATIAKCPSKLSPCRCPNNTHTCRLFPPSKSTPRVL